MVSVYVGFMLSENLQKMFTAPYHDFPDEP